MSENDEFLAEFLAESSDILEKTNQVLDQYPSWPDISAALDTLFRNIHTIKGASSMFNYSNTKTLAHALETRLSQFKANPSLLNISEIQDIRKQLQSIEYLIRAKDQPQESIPSVERVPDQAPQQNTKPEMPVAPSTPLPPASTNSSTDEFVRVPVKRVDEIMNGISEVFLIRNQMVYLSECLKSKSVKENDFFQQWDILDNSLRRSMGELERSAMSMRLMTVQGLFTKMSRIVQSYNSNGKKKIQVRILGESTELDKKVLDVLSEPMIHLVRNAMDHGIEACEDRILAKKSETGTITLSASIVGNEAVIQVSDDGKGMDPKNILASARKKGLNVDHVTDDRSAIDLIFLPGFSTAESVSDISGRGVGMDAVRTSVSGLGGRIVIDSQVGRGSTFTIKLPVSMSLVPVVLVDIKGYKYAVALQEVLETRRMNPSQIQENTGKIYAKYQNSFVECIDIRSLVSAKVATHSESVRESSVLFFKYSDHVVAAQVSYFEKNTEIVAKPLSPLAPKIDWLSGAAVLPTGEPIFVLSLTKLYEIAKDLTDVAA